jgi:hypothetical protein
VVRGGEFDSRCIGAAIVQLECRRCIVLDVYLYDSVAVVVEVYGNRRQPCFRLCHLRPSQRWMGTSVVTSQVQVLSSSSISTHVPFSS